MINKSKRTIDKYMQAGAKLRLLKTLLCDTIVETSELMYAKDTDKFIKMEQFIQGLCSKLESQMYTDLNLQGNEYTSVFYGATTNKPKPSDVDAYMHMLIQNVVDSLICDSQDTDSFD